MVTIVFLPQLSASQPPSSNSMSLTQSSHQKHDLESSLPMSVSDGSSETSQISSDEDDTSAEELVSKKGSAGTLCSSWREEGCVMFLYSSLHRMEAETRF